jgi:hypothetical protein
MGKKIARWARLVRDIAGAAVALLKVIKAIVEIVNLAANCNAQKLRVQVPVSRKIHLQTQC